MMVTLFLKKSSRKAGLPPGTPVFVGERKVESTRISYMDYDENKFEEKIVDNVEECFPFKDTPTVTWINTDGIHNVDKIEKLGKHFNLHPLLLEDIVNTGQRPKIEEFDQHILIISKMLTYDENLGQTVIEQVSLILGKNFILSFQERSGDLFDPIRERIRTGKGRVRKMGSDYLAYSLLDAIVDGYFIILEKIGDRLEDLEDRVSFDAQPETLQEIHKLKREMIFLRKSVWPLREVLGHLEKGESTLIKKTSRIYLRDVYDHTIQVIDTIETYRDMILGMHDTYLSSISNKMNEVMKMLTIIATIFIPLTFIAGIYGMNFEFMPELKWHGSYFAVWGVILAIAVFMLAFFRRKKWL